MKENINELKMEENINELIDIPLKDLGINFNDLHHVEVVYSSPDTWFTIKHRKGEKKKSFFRNLFNLKLKTYDESIIYSSYTKKRI